MSHALVCGFYYFGMFAYVAGSPFVFIDYHQLPPSFYGLIFTTCVVGITIGNPHQFAPCDAHRAAHKLTGPVQWAPVCSGCGWRSARGLIWAVRSVSSCPMFLFVSCTGLILPNALSGALESSTNDAGAISALCGAIQYGGGIFGSGLVGLCADGTAWPLGLLLALSGVGTLGFGLLLEREGSPIGSYPERPQ